MKPKRLLTELAQDAKQKPWIDFEIKKFVWSRTIDCFETLPRSHSNKSGSHWRDNWSHNWQMTNIDKFYQTRRTQVLPKIHGTRVILNRNNQLKCLFRTNCDAKNNEKSGRFFNQHSTNISFWSHERPHTLLNRKLGTILNQVDFEIFVIIKIAKKNLEKNLQYIFEPASIISIVFWEPDTHTQYTVCFEALGVPLMK